MAYAKHFLQQNALSCFSLVLPGALLFYFLEKSHWIFKGYIKNNKMEITHKEYEMKQIIAVVFTYLFWG